jgi:hypothetical protein
VRYIVGAERLGLPAKPGFFEWLGISQRQLRYEVNPDEPTATCHVQPGDDLPALCEFPWECLVPVPGGPAWWDIDPVWRCEECTDALAKLEAAD